MQDLDVYVVPLAELEDDDDGLQQLKFTKAEAKARGWAREWACARIAALHGLHVDAIHDQLKAEVKSPAPTSKLHRRFAFNGAPF